MRISHRGMFLVFIDRAQSSLPIAHDLIFIDSINLFAADNQIQTQKIIHLLLEKGEGLGLLKNGGILLRVPPFFVITDQL